LFLDAVLWVIRAHIGMIYLSADDRRVIDGIIYVIKRGLQWKDAPKAYGPHKTLYNRFVRWSLLGMFDKIAQIAVARGLAETVALRVEGEVVEIAF
jgi:transposase